MMRKLGFTIIEVSLFLAITAAIFAGVAIGTQNTIWQQKFNDSVQDFAEFLRGIYSQVSNPQGIGTGQSTELAIYGKLVTFGESCGLEYNAGVNAAGQLINCQDDGESHVYVYDVVGDVNGTGAGSMVSALDSIHANVMVVIKGNNNKVNNVVPAGIVQSFVPRWMATIEQTNFDGFGQNTRFRGSILVVRHPRSGTINTLVSTDVLEVNKAITEAKNLINSGGTPNVSSFLTSRLGSFDVGPIDFCINPEGQDKYSGNRANLKRRDVRLVANARNASGVELIDLDSNDNKCRY